jgi:hypothetical protein
MEGRLAGIGTMTGAARKETMLGAVVARAIVGREVSAVGGEVVPGNAPTLDVQRDGGSCIVAGKVDCCSGKQSL